MLLKNSVYRRLNLRSVDLCYPYSIRKAGVSLGKPTIFSAGMRPLKVEIIRAVEQLDEIGLPYALLHCNSTYPAPETDIQLRYLTRLRELHDSYGYSVGGTVAPQAAVALGAKIVERHITLASKYGNGRPPCQLEAGGEFRGLVEGIRQVEKALPWMVPTRHASQGELLLEMRKSREKRGCGPR